MFRPFLGICEKLFFKTLILLGIFTARACAGYWTQRHPATFQSDKNFRGSSNDRFAPELQVIHVGRRVHPNWVGAGYATAASVVAATTPGGTPSLNVTTRRGPELEDAEVWYQPKGSLFKVWAGQGKVAFTRQEMTSSGKQQFVDRWAGNALYAPGRDQGLRLEGINDSNKSILFIILEC